MSRLDACVRQAYREDPRAAHLLLADHAEFPELTLAMAKRKVPLIPWAHFVARVRDLHRNGGDYNPEIKAGLTKAHQERVRREYPYPDHNGGWEPPLG